MAERAQVIRGEPAGAAQVVRPAYPDPTATEGDWSAVDLAPCQALAAPVSLATLKADPLLREMLLVRQSRLSVVSVTPEQWARLLKLGRTRL